MTPIFFKHFRKSIVCTIFTALISSPLIVSAAGGDDGPQAYDLETLQQIEKGAPIIRADTGNIDRIRREVLRDNAMTLGAQGGLLSRSKEINGFLSEHAESLDNRFQFQPLLINRNVLPPVVIEAKNTIAGGEDGRILRVADATYNIHSNARFVVIPPTWREYLFLNESPVDIPHETVVPQNEDEQQFWKQMVSEGWDAGVDQADVTYDLNLSRLERDYIGMITFRRLLVQGKVREPKVERNRLGVTGDATNMAINDRIQEITEGASFELESYDWMSPVLPDDRAKIKIVGSKEETREVIGVDSKPRKIREAKAEKQDAIRERLKTTIDNWVSAWTSGNSSAYLDYYGDEFEIPQKGLERKAWEWRRKVSIGNAKGVIDVETRDLNITYSEDGRYASVGFEQEYRFGSERGRVPKAMLWSYDETIDAWEIHYEQETSARTKL